MSKLTDRINELAKKQKTEGLTEEEKKEQAELREEFRRIFRSNFQIQMESIKVEKK